MTSILEQSNVMRNVGSKELENGEILGIFCGKKTQYDIYGYC